MVWLPISGTVPQYSTSANELADNYYLKFYASGTTTPVNMATDSTGGTTLAKCALSAEGYPITNPLDDSTRFIPHIDQDYRIVLYSNETDADNNTTASAVFNIDGMVLQVTPSADAVNITLRDTNIEAQDDYDRSPLFVDGDGFTAGAGPHTISVPSYWTPSNSDMRFYKLDNSGIVTPLTPTGTTSSDFTLADTLLATDTIFIGDDTFRDLMDYRSEQKTLDNNLVGIMNIQKIKNTITITVGGSAGLRTTAGTATLHATSSGWLPVWARPTAVSVITNMTIPESSYVVFVDVLSDGTFRTQYKTWSGAGSSQSFTAVATLDAVTISYNV